MEEEEEIVKEKDKIQEKEKKKKKTGRERGRGEGKEEEEDEKRRGEGWEAYRLQIGNKGGCITFSQALKKVEGDSRFREISEEPKRDSSVDEKFKDDYVGSEFLIGHETEKTLKSFTH